MEKEKNFQEKDNQDQKIEQIVQQIRMRTQVPKHDFRQEIYKRVISGVILGGIALFFLIKGGILFVFFVSIFSLLASFEIYKLLEMKGEKPFTQIGIAVSTSIPFITFLAPSEVLFALLTFSLIAIFFIQIISREVRGAIDKIMMTYFGIIYTGWLGGAHAVLLRNIGSELQIRNFAKIDTGIFFFLFTVLTTVCADIGAYFAGKKFGKIKLAEKISPGKTLEGFLGGVLLSVISAIFMKIIFQPKGDLMIWMFLGFVAAFFGLLGDFAESALKRDVHLKDSGFIIPGHGGVLDRIDSLLFTIPIFYYISKYIILKL